MIFFDFIFYRVCRAYSKTIDQSPEITALCLVSMLQTFTIIFFAELLEVVTSFKMPLNKIVWLSPVIIILVINYFRYINKKGVYTKLEQKWNSLPKTAQKRKRLWIILYIWSTIILTIGLTIYLGGKANHQF